MSIFVLSVLFSKKRIVLTSISLSLASKPIYSKIKFKSFVFVNCPFWTSKLLPYIKNPLNLDTNKSGWELFIFLILREMLYLSFAKFKSLLINLIEFNLFASVFK